MASRNANDIGAIQWNPGGPKLDHAKQNKPIVKRGATSCKLAKGSRTILSFTTYDRVATTIELLVGVFVDLLFESCCVFRLDRKKRQN